MDAIRRSDRPIAEQVIAVPKISCSSCPSRAVLREPQTAEQLAKVPTILYFLKQPIAEHIVDIPVPRRGFSVGGPQGFLPGQRSSSSAEQIIDTPASGRGSSGDLQGFIPRHGTFKRTAEQIVDIPVLRGLGQDFQKFPPGGRAAALPAVFQGEHFQGFFFALFPKLNKVRSHPRVPAGQPMDAGGL